MQATIPMEKKPIFFFLSKNHSTTPAISMATVKARITYWKKYFIEVYKIKNKTELSQMISEYKFKESDIRWEELMRAF